MKLLIPLAIVVATITMPSAADAAAAGCPAGKDLLSIEDTLNRVDYSIYNEEDAAAVMDLVEALDANGNNDGFLCSKAFKPNQGQDKHWGGTNYMITQISDNQPTGRL